MIRKLPGAVEKLPEMVEKMPEMVEKLPDWPTERATAAKLASA